MSLIAFSKVFYVLVGPGHVNLIAFQVLDNSLQLLLHNEVIEFYYIFYNMVLYFGELGFTLYYNILHLKHIFLPEEFIL